MLKTISELKEFINWAKANGLSEAKIGDIEFKFDPSVNASPGFTTIKNTEKLSELDAQKIDDEELLYWSSKG
jgi:hypothetical protein